MKLRYHREWDKKVIAITGGLSIMTPIKGQWLFTDSGEVFKERMIPVRISATEDQMKSIVNMTIDHYEQLAVMAYKVSDNVMYVEADSDTIEKWKEKDKIGMKTYDWA